MFAYVEGDPLGFVDPYGLKWQSTAWCFAKGAAVGAVGAVVVGGVAVGAAMAGVPVAVVTGVLGTAAVVGATVAGFNIGDNLYKNNFDAAAFGLGTMVGGFAGGFAGVKIPLISGNSGNPILGRAVAEGINRVPSGTFKWNDSFQNYDRSMGSIWKWLSTGPNPGSAALSVSGSAGGGSSLTSSCDCK